MLPRYFVHSCIQYYNAHNIWVTFFYELMFIFQMLHNGLFPKVKIKSYLIINRGNAHICKRGEGDFALFQMTLTNPTLWHCHCMKRTLHRCQEMGCAMAALRSLCERASALGFRPWSFCL